MTAPSTTSRDGLLDAARAVVPVLLLGVVPIALVAAFTLGTLHHSPAYDFRAFWDAARDVAHGRSPYLTVDELPSDPHAAIDAYVYPPLVAIVFLPFGLLPFTPAALIYLGIALLASAAALRILGVRDWRCYGAVAVSACALDAWRLGTLTPLLLLGLAMAWRYRDRALLVASAVTVLTVAKVFLAPLFLWLLVTRRLKAASVAAGATALTLLVSWAVIGFAGLRDYPALMSRLTDVEYAKSYSVMALVRSLGVPTQGARDAALLLCVALGVVLVLRGRGRDRDAFFLSLGLALVLTPILWLHYLLLLVVPIAITRPRFELLWLAPAATWLIPFPESGGSTWRIVTAVALSVVVFVATTSPATLPRTSA